MVRYIVDELPDKYKPVVKRMIENGVIGLNEDGTINASEEILEIYTVLGRLGLI